VSAAIAARIAHVAFWGLLLYGGVRGELTLKRIAVFLLLWLAGFFGSPHVANGDALFVAFVAMLDVALVLMIFKGDVRVF